MSEQYEGEEQNSGFLAGLLVGLSLGGLLSWLVVELLKRYVESQGKLQVQPETVTQVVEVEKIVPDPDLKAKLEASQAKIQLLKHQLASVETPAVGKVDDLKLIDGVGPKSAKVLQEAGYTSFAALGAATREELRAVLDAAGMPKSINPSSWPAQARERS